MRPPKLAALELRRFARGKLPAAALVALLLLPLLYGALYLWSFWDPYGRLDKIPVALVNEDAGATARGRHLSAGDDIVRELGRSDSFDWHTVSAAQAREGVADGSYYLSLSIPHDFSRKLATSAGDHPETGALKVRTNDANNYIVGQISRTVFSEIRSAASAKASRGFLDDIYVSFATLHDKTADAAKGAGSVHDGLGDAEKGADRLSGGLETAHDGSGALVSGLAQLDAGAAKLSSSSRTLAKGAGSLSSGADRLKDGAGTLSSGAGQVAAGTQKLSDTVDGLTAGAGPFLDRHGAEIGRAAQLVADGSKDLRDHLDRLGPAASSGARLSKGVSDDLDALRKARCPAGGGAGHGMDAASCARLARIASDAASAADTAHSVDVSVHDVKQLDQLRDDLDQVHHLATELAQHGPTLGKDLDQAVAQIDTLNTGAHKVAAGARTLSAGAGTLSGGARKLADGNSRLADGADRLRSGADKASSGARKLDGGLSSLTSGARSLDGGLYKLSDGSARLADGLRDGVHRIPDYGDKARDARTSVMSDPVRLASHDAHKAPNYGTGFAPYFIPLSLWVGAMVAYMLIPPLNRRALAVGAGAWRTTLAGWLPVVAVGLVQVAALMSVLHFALGLQMVRAAGTLGFLALVTACFGAVVQWLNARFGPAGRILVLALLMLQLTSAGGTYPVQTSPSFFGALHPFLPMSYVVEGLRRLITGGDLAPVWQGSAVLAAFTVVALALTALSARGRQVVRMKDLHPELSL